MERLQRALGTEILDPRFEDGRLVVAADLLVERLVEASIARPSTMLPFLKEFMDRDEGRTDGRNVEDEEGAEDKAAEIRRFIAEAKKTIPERAEDAEPEDAEVEKC